MSPIYTACFVFTSLPLETVFKIFCVPRLCTTPTKRIVSTRKNPAFLWWHNVHALNTDLILHRIWLLLRFANFLFTFALAVAGGFMRLDKKVGTNPPLYVRPLQRTLSVGDFIQLICILQARAEDTARWDYVDALLASANTAPREFALC